MAGGSDPGTPAAFETVFEWVLTGTTNQLNSEPSVISHHTLTTSCDDLLRRFWEVEENVKHGSNLSPEERSVVQHFHENHQRTIDGRYPRNLMPRYWVNQDHMQREDFCHSNAPCMPRVNLKPLTSRIFGNEACGTSAHGRSGKAPTQRVLSPYACCQEGIKHDHKNQSSI